MTIGMDLRSSLRNDLGKGSTMFMQCCLSELMID